MPDPTAAEKLRAGIIDGAGTMQQNLIRMLITHPGTTALNLVGWATASQMSSVSDILRGALY